MRKTTPRYPVDRNGKYIIELKVDSLRQLFDERDPNPFRERDLDDDAVEYIVSSAEEVSAKKVSRLKIITFDQVNDQTRSVITYAVRDYFLYRADITGKKLRWTLNMGVRSLIIGLICMAFAIFSSRYFGPFLENNFWESFTKEGLLLMSWVSMWKPINIFLYEWWPLLELKKVYKTLSTVDIDLVQFEKLSTDLFGSLPRVDTKVTG